LDYLARVLVYGVGLTVSKDVAFSAAVDMRYTDYQYSF